MVLRKLFDALRKGHEKRREKKLTKALAIRHFTRVLHQAFTRTRPPKTIFGRRLAVEETALFVREEKLRLKENRNKFTISLKKKGLSAEEFVKLIDEVGKGAEPWKSKQKRLLKRAGAATLSQINTATGLGERDQFTYVLEVVNNLYGGGVSELVPVNIAIEAVLREVFHLEL